MHSMEVASLLTYDQRLTSSMPMHPLPIMINNGLPVALCSDDPAVFGNMGLTYDYFQVRSPTAILLIALFNTYAE